MVAVNLYALKAYKVDSRNIQALQQVRSISTRILKLDPFGVASRQQCGEATLALYFCNIEGLKPNIVTNVLFKWEASVNPASLAACLMLLLDAIALTAFWILHHRTYFRMVMPTSFLNKCSSLLSDNEHSCNKSENLTL